MNKPLMKKTFVSTSQNLTPECQELIEEIRSGILDANQNGVFLQLGISPAVLTDDFVLRVSTYCKLQKRDNSNIVVGYWIVKATTTKFPQVWLLAVLESAASSRPGAIEKQPETLPLVTFSKTNWNPDNSYFDSLADQVVSILTRHFPVVYRRLVSSMNDDTSSKQIPTAKTGSELQEALLKFKAMREQGLLPPKRRAQQKESAAPISTHGSDTIVARTAVEEPELNHILVSTASYERMSSCGDENGMVVEREKLVPATDEEEANGTISVPVVEPLVAMNPMSPVVVLMLKTFFIFSCLALIVSWLFRKIFS